MSVDTWETTEHVLLRDDSEAATDPDGMSLEEIGRVLGVTRERARQIEKDALTKVRIALQIVELVGEARADAPLRWLRGKSAQKYVDALEALRAAAEKRGEPIIVERR